MRDRARRRLGSRAREFLERTALRGRARRQRPALPASTRSSPRRPQAHRARNAAADAAQRPDRPLRHPDDGEPVVRPLLRLAARHADGKQSQRYPNPRGRARARRATPRRSAPAASSTRAAATRTPATAGTRAARSSTAASSRRARGNDEFALTYFNQGDLGFIHEAARNYTLYDRYFCSILASTWPNRYYKWSAQSGGLEDQHASQPGGNNWETIFDRAISQRPDRRATTPPTCRSPRCSGPRAGRLDQPDLALLRGLRRGHAAEHRDRRPALPRRRRRRRAVGRRAPARRRAARPGVHGRRGATPSPRSPNYRRGALFVIYDEWGGFFDHVRPPRVPDDRASTDLERGLRPDGLPRPGRGGLAVRPPRQEALARERDFDGWGYNHVAASTTASTAHESILKLHLATASGSATSTSAHEVRATTSGAASTGGAPDFEPPELPDPPTIVTQPCALGGGDVLDSPGGARERPGRPRARRRALQACRSTRASPTTSSRMPDTIKKGIAGGARVAAATAPSRVRRHGDADC